MTTDSPSREGSPPPLLAWYGDDFTGSTDVLEALALQGIEAVLAPNPGAVGAACRHLPGAQAVGIAGLSRSMAPADMTAELEPAFRALAALQPEILHYKVCSTFDSSPSVGSIGHALEVGRSVTGAVYHPLMVAAPRLRRYVAFGNLFATVDGVTYRLDRHPTMSRHPVTPMQEADLRLHLSRQTTLPVANADLHQIHAGPDHLRRFTEEWMGSVPAGGVLLFDGLQESDLEAAGRILWSLREDLGRLVVGSSGVEWALGAAWRREGVIGLPPQPRSPGPVAALLVVSGSASPATAGQIAWAEAQGYGVEKLDLPLLLDPGGAGEEYGALLTRVAESLDRGCSTVLCSARGPTDPAISETRARFPGWDPAALAQEVGKVLGRILRDLVDRTPRVRVCVCGGDTSGWVSRALGIEALTFVAPLTPGSPFCLAHRGAGHSSLEIVLKGGQNGSNAFFESVRLGRPEFTPRV